MFGNSFLENNNYKKLCPDDCLSFKQYIFSLLSIITTTVNSKNNKNIVPLDIKFFSFDMVNNGFSLKLKLVFVEDRTTKTDVVTCLHKI